MRARRVVAVTEMSCVMSRPFALPPCRTTAVGTVTALLAGWGCLLVATAAPAAASEWGTPGAAGYFAVHGSGNGHGHGMSQYGAQGAAIAGRTTAQILAFYYPGTALSTLAPSTVRVRLSGAASDTTVFAGGRLTVTKYGALPASGYSQFRLSPYGGGLALAGRRGSSWRALAKDLPARADFSSSAGWVQALLSDGSSTRYRGSVGALRSGSGEYTINRVGLDGYTEGVVPREMPASWRAAAVGAQAVAARTYARNAVESGSGAYDICDTTSCQVYGGMAHYSSGGSLQWTDDPAAIVGNESRVLTYHGSTIFAQFSASDGGATVDGGQSYLLGKPDPYDGTASGDPYLNWSDAASASHIAGYYGLKSVTSIEITRRDGNGPWGGRVLAASVHGTNYSGSSVGVASTGYSLASALGLMTPLFHFDYQQPLPSAPRSVTTTVNNASAVVRWEQPANASSATITGYVLHWGLGHELRVAASARSAFVTPLYLRTSQRIWVQAVNARGAGPESVVRAHGTPTLHGIVSLPRARLFDSRALHRSVDAAHPFWYDLAGQGDLPATGLRSVQLTVTVLNPTASGRVSIYTKYAPSQRDAVIQYQKGKPTTATVSVQLQPSTTLRFVPSAGSIGLLADQQSYSTWNSPRVRAVAPTLAGTVWRVAQDDSATGSSQYRGSTVSLAGAPGVTADTTAVLVSLESWTHGSTAVTRIWPDGLARPWIVDASVGSGPNVNTVLVPLPASQRLRLSSSASDSGARVTLLGVVGNGGGLLETYPSSVLATGLTVGTSVRTQQLAGIAQVPWHGTSAVYLQITVSSPGHAGKLYAWPSGTARPAAAVIAFGVSGNHTATALVKLGAGQSVNLSSTVNAALVTIASFGYLTTS